jgi:16S rRNA (guanine527-N7)-methyltransferase
MADSAAPQHPQTNWRLETWFNQIPKEQIALLKVHFEELNRSMKVSPLVSAKSLAFADGLHYADSILALAAVFSDNPKIDVLYDLGSGAGFPGLVGAVLYSKVKFVLVETDKKSVDHLTHCISAMGLKNVELLNQSFETLPANSFKFGITRGVSTISKVILATRKSVSVGGVLYHMKAENWGMEVADIPTQLCSVWSPGLVKEYRLPIGEVRFAIVKTDKIS